MDLSDPIFETEMVAGLVVVRAGVAIQWVPVMGTILGAGSDGSILECRFTEVG